MEVVVLVELVQLVVDRELVEGLVRGVVGTGEVEVEKVEEGSREVDPRGAAEVEVGVVDTGVVEVVVDIGVAAVVEVTVVEVL